MRKPAKIARIFRFLVILLAALCWHALRSISGCIIAYIDYPWFLVQTLLERYEAVLWHTPGIGTQSVPIRYFLPAGTREKCTKRANSWSTYSMLIFGSHQSLVGFWSVVWEGF